MKKLLLLITLCSLAFQSKAQIFALTPEGTFLDKRAGKDFIVKQYEGASEADLYRFVENRAVELLSSPNDMLTKTEDMISLMGTTTFHSKSGLIRVEFTYKYKILVHLKGDKVRYSVTPIALYTDSYKWVFSMFFNKKGELRKSESEAYIDLNSRTNELVSHLFYTEEEANLDWEESSRNSISISTL